MKEYEKNPMMEMVEQGMKSYEQFFGTGLKFQEQASQYWSALCNPVNATKAQKRVSVAAMVEEVVPLAQKRMEEVVDLMDKNAQASAELTRKAVEAVDANATERHIKWAEFWKTSLKAVRTNADDMMQMNVRAVDGWVDLIQKNIEISEIKVETPRSSSRS